MAKKHLSEDGILLTGESAHDVTGSQYLLTFAGHKALLECGLYQSSKNEYLDAYRVNSRRFNFKPSEIEYVFVAHPHIDHCGLLPRLIKQGFHGKIIMTPKSFEVMKALLLNSCYIVQTEARLLTKKYGRYYEPLYSENDVYNTFNLVETYAEYKHIYTLNSEISFQWLKNSHCLGAAQLQIILDDGLKHRKVLYTSDIGPLKTINHYVPNTEIPESFNDIVIMESTYGDKREAQKRSRYRDMEKLEASIIKTVERGGTVLLPCFSFSRTQEVLTCLYELFHKTGFAYPIYVDSDLTCQISRIYSNILDDDDLELWNQVSNHPQVRFIADKLESKMIKADRSPKVVLSSSGFCTNGRIVGYLNKYLSDTNSMIIFTGFTGSNPSYLSYRIKNDRDHKKIKINGVMIPNRADCLSVSSFSSHAAYDDLITFGSSLNTNKLVLVHGSEEAKKMLADGLKVAISKNDKTYTVQISTKGQFIRL